MSSPGHVPSGEQEEKTRARLVAVPSSVAITWRADSRQQRRSPARLRLHIARPTALIQRAAPRPPQPHAGIGYRSREGSFTTTVVPPLSVSTSTHSRTRTHARRHNDYCSSTNYSSRRSLAKPTDRIRFVVRSSAKRFETAGRANGVNELERERQLKATRRRLRVGNRETALLTEFDSVRVIKSGNLVVQIFRIAVFVSAMRIRDHLCVCADVK